MGWEWATAAGHCSNLDWTYIGSSHQLKNFVRLVFIFYLSVFKPCKRVSLMVIHCIFIYSFGLVYLTKAWIIGY